MKFKWMPNEKGASLVSGLVAAGLLGVMSMALASITVFTQKAGSGDRTSESANAIQQEVRSVFGRRTVCTGNFEGELFDPEVPFDVKARPRSKKLAPGMGKGLGLFHKNGNFNSPVIDPSTNQQKMLLPIWDAATDAAGYGYKAGLKVKNVRFHKIRKMADRNETANAEVKVKISELYLMQAEIALEAPQSSTGVRTLTRVFPMMFRVQYKEAAKTRHILHCSAPMQGESDGKKLCDLRFKGDSRYDESSGNCYEDKIGVVTVRSKAGEHFVKCPSGMVRAQTSRNLQGCSVWNVNADKVGYLHFTGKYTGSDGVSVERQTSWPPLSTREEGDDACRCGYALTEAEQLNYGCQVYCQEP